MPFNLVGTLKVIKDTRKVSDTFQVREFVITDNSSMYPQDISFQLSQDKCTLIDDFKTGEIIDVHFNIRGREWTSPQGEVRYFNTLEAWRIQQQGAQASQPASVAPNTNTATATPSVPEDLTSESSDDDLPF